MEYEKNTGKFSFGFGTARTAGVGKISDIQKIQVKHSNKVIAKKAVIAGLQAMATIAVIGLKIRFSGKNRRD